MKYRIAASAVALALGLAALAPAAPPTPAKAPAPTKAPLPTKTPAPASDSLAYAPPSLPEPPAAGPLLLRLALATFFVLGLGGVASWAVRRHATGQPDGKSDPRLRLLETLPLGNGGSLHLLECCGKRFVAGVSPSGLRSLAPLPEAFESELDVLTSLRQ